MRHLSKNFQTLQNLVQFSQPCKLTIFPNLRNLVRCFYGRWHLKSYFKIVYENEFSYSRKNNSSETER